MHTQTTSFPCSSKTQGFTLIEVMTAVAVVGVGLAGVMTVNSQVLRIVQTAKRANTATVYLQERTEMMRNAAWVDLTSAAFYQQQYFTNTPTGAEQFPGREEIVTIEAYPDEKACTPLVLSKSATGSARVESSGTGLSSQRMARVSVHLEWDGGAGKIQRRESTTVISNGGISRMNLPGMGNFAGGIFGDPTGGATSPTTNPPSTTDPVPTTDPGPTPTPDPVPTDPTPTPTTDPSPSSGKGNSDNSNKGGKQGNLGGKPGKG